jgi:hypothetical protein
MQHSTRCDKLRLPWRLADSVTVVLQDDGGDNHVAGDHTLGSFFSSHLAQSGFEGRYDQDAEE